MKKNSYSYDELINCGNGGLFGPKSFFGPKVHFGPQNRFLGPKAKNGPKMRFWAQKCFFRKRYPKVKVGRRVPHREPGFPASRPDSIHGRTGLRKLVAFSVPLHSNYGPK